MFVTPKMDNCIKFNNTTIPINWKEIYIARKFPYFNKSHRFYIKVYSKGLCFELYEKEFEDKFDKVITLGKKINDYRLEKGITLGDFAEKINISIYKLSEFERTVDIPSEDILKKLIQETSIDLNKFIGISEKCIDFNKSMKGNLIGVTYSKTNFFIG